MRNPLSVLTSTIAIICQVCMSAPAAANEQAPTETACVESDGWCAGWNLFVVLNTGGGRDVALATTGEKYGTKRDCTDAGKALILSPDLNRNYVDWICAPAPKG